ILGAARGEGARWAKDLQLPTKGETIFFAGCGYQYATGLETMLSLLRRLEKSAVGADLPLRLAKFQQKMGMDLGGVYRRVRDGGSGADVPPLKDAVKVLRHLGVEFAYLAEEEPCCGAPLYFAGVHREFTRNAQQACRKLASLGVKRVISIVPSCTYALREIFPTVVPGYELEVKHFVEIVAGALPSLKLCFPWPAKVAFHDPCQLARYLGLTAEPRQILKAIQGIELVEPEGTCGEWATCCGGGGGFEAVFPELSQVLAVNRVRELLETGADIIVTHCPGCVLQLKEGLKELKSTVPVLDLVEVVAMALEA
ncbi:MAG: (Fe-S)-binding protein, partial [Chloroflexota bacterium]